MGRAADAVMGLRPFAHARRTPALLWAAVLLVCAFMLLPIVYLAVRAGQAETVSWDLILRNRTVWLALRSVGLAAAVTSAAVLVGVPLAWLTVRTDLPARRIWGVLLALPLVIPSYVGAFALLAALGPRGMLQSLLEGPLGIERLPGISGFAGAFLALTLFTYPYVYLLASAGIRGLDPSLEDASRSLGRTRISTFRSVTLPMLKPSIAAGGLLVALYTLHDFGAVSLMRFNTFTQAIYLQYRGAFDRTPAAILSLMLVAIAALVLMLERRARGQARYFRSGSGTQRPPLPLSLGRWKVPAFLLCVLVVLVALVLPMSVIVFWLIRGVSAGTDVAFTWGAAGGSVLVSAAGAALAVAAGFPVALLAARQRNRGSVIAERIAYAGYALPGIVVALAFVFMATRFAPWIYQTLPLVVLAYVALFLPQASEPLRAALLQMGPRMEEAGRALGRSRAQVMWRVVAPLISRGALVGGALVFLTAMKELPATLLLRPTGFESLATRVWSGAAVGLFSKAAAPALLLVLICSIPLYVLVRRIEVQEVEVKAD